MLYEPFLWLFLWCLIGFASLLFGNWYFASEVKGFSSWFLGIILGPITTVIIILNILEE